MTDHTPFPASPVSGRDETLLDTILREAIPEIKLALGDLIDRDGQRAVPDRYARFLPESTLAVTLRPDAAAAILPVAAELERELTESCMRHGSLYDREYRVKLREAASPGAPLFRVSTVRAGEAEPAAELGTAARSAPPPPPSTPSPPNATELADEGTVHAPARPHVAEPLRVERIEPHRPEAPSRAPGAGPSIDPDATRLEGIAPPAPPQPKPEGPAGPRWDAERWVLVIESEEGEERERFPIPRPMTTVGRETDKPELRSDVSISNAPHVSRRQLALVWAPRGDRGGFTVYNLGLNPVHVEGREIAGANTKGPLQLEDLMAGHTEWVAPDTPMRIGEHGPVLRVVEIVDDEEPRDDRPPVDPDATQFG